MSRQHARRGAGAAGAALLALVLAGCGAEGYQPAGPFRPLPEGAPPQVGPPTESLPAPAPDPDGPGDPGEGGDGEDPNVVATGLTVPTGLVVLPDGTAIVAERDTGRLLQVFPDRSPARELMTVPVDTAGDGGLLGLALSPTFVEDGLLYAYVSTAEDNRVVRFPVGGTPNPVLTGIPRGETRNGGGLTFGPDGSLYVGTGDTGDPALAADPASLAGKVLHVDVFGQPIGGGPVHSRGHSDVTALCLGGDGTLYATDEHADGPDELEVVVGGGDHGWPSPGPGTLEPLLEIENAEGGLGGCAAAGGTVYLGARDGQQVHVVELDGGAATEEPTAFLADRYGRLRTVATDPEGALWITTSNRDGIGSPAEDDDKVLRVLPPGGAAESPL